MYEKFLPKFKVVEINLSTAHLIGHVIAQAPAYVEGEGNLLACVEKGDGYKFIENGIMAGLGADGRLSNYNPEYHSRPCLVYNDELITGPFDSLNQYAHYVGETGKCGAAYVRALPLYLNDTFTTNNYVGTASDVCYGHLQYEEVEGTKKYTGLIEVSGEMKDALFIGKKTVLPNGKDEAVEFTYIGK